MVSAYAFWQMALPDKLRLLRFVIAKEKKGRNEYSYWQPLCEVVKKRELDAPAVLRSIAELGGNLKADCGLLVEAIREDNTAVVKELIALHANVNDSSKMWRHTPLT